MGCCVSWMVRSCQGCRNCSSRGELAEEGHRKLVARAVARIRRPYRWRAYREEVEERVDGSENVHTQIRWRAESLAVALWLETAATGRG